MNDENIPQPTDYERLILALINRLTKHLSNRVQARGITQIGYRTTGGDPDGGITVFRHLPATSKKE